MPPDIQMTFSPKDKTIWLRGQQADTGQKDALVSLTQNHQMCRFAIPTLNTSNYTLEIP